jgi:hypothetical protein
LLRSLCERERRSTRWRALRERASHAPKYRYVPGTVKLAAGLARLPTGRGGGRRARRTTRVVLRAYCVANSPISTTQMIREAAHEAQRDGRAQGRIPSSGSRFR